MKTEIISSIIRASRLGVVLLAMLSMLVGCDRSEDAVQQKEQAKIPHTLKVVGLFPMTGPGASLGTFLNNGVTLAKEKLEQDYHGKLKIEFEVVDTKNQPKEAISGLHSATARSKPHAVISALSSVSSAIKPVVESEGIFTVATTTALSNLVQGTHNIIRVYPTATNFARPIAHYAKKHFTRTAVLYVHDDFGESVYQAFKQAVSSSQVQIVSANPYELLQKDTRTLIDRILGDKPEAIYVIGYGPAYVNVIKQIRELSPETNVLADISFPNPAVLAALGDAAEGVIFDGTDAELTTPETESATHFRRLYIERFNADPFMVAGFAYDALAVIAQVAMSREQFTSPTKAGAIRLSPFEGIMGTIQLDQDGESNIDLKLMTRVDRKTVLLNE